MTTIKTVWTYVKRVYEYTRRDIIYAYGGTFADIDRCYETNERECKIVVLFDAHQREVLRTFGKVFADLAERFGVVLVALTWFGRDDAATDDAAAVMRRQFELDLIECYSGSDGYDCDDDEYERDAFEIATTSTTSNEPPARRKRKIIEEDESKGAIVSSQPQRPRKFDTLEHTFAALMEAPRPINDDDEEFDDDDEPSVETVINSMRACYGIRETEDGSRFVVNCTMRNRILSQFFAELILYVRPFMICDKLGVIKHRSFRLISSHTVTRWYKELLSISATE